MTTPDIPALAARLTKANVAALETLPMPGWAAHRVFAGMGRNVPHSSTWRKSTKHYDSMVRLEDMGLVERTVSRGETLWRLTKPLGLAVRQHLQEQSA